MTDPQENEDSLSSILRSAHVLLEEFTNEGVDRFQALPNHVLRAEESAQAPVVAPNAPHTPSAATPLPDLSSLSLEELRAASATCTQCRLAEGRTKVVFGEGNPNADILFVGEGPGEQEDLQGIPFCGRAGELLTSMIEKGMGIGREDVYTCNVVKCRPPQNRTPLVDEVGSCRGFLDAQIQRIAPKVIVALGKPATSLLMGKAVAISKVRGTWQSYRGIPVMPTFHPAFILRQYTAENRRLVWEDLKAALGKSTD
jgi:uracil-DNA glycosylase family 4